MNAAELRRSLLPLIVGIIASLAGLLAARAWSPLAGVVVGILVAFVLFRAYLFVLSRRS